MEHGKKTGKITPKQCGLRNCDEEKYFRARFFSVPLFLSLSLPPVDGRRYGKRVILHQEACIELSTSDRIIGAVRVQKKKKQNKDREERIIYAAARDVARLSDC